MPSRGRPKTELVLTEEERTTLTRWAQRRTSSQALASRSSIVLGCAEGTVTLVGWAASGGLVGSVG
jgi:hypothetical protein